jgi:hypothetical protein
LRGEKAVDYHGAAVSGRRKAEENKFCGGKAAGMVYRYTDIESIKFLQNGMGIYMAYSADYRKAAVEYKQNGHTFKDLKEVFRITPPTYYKWAEILEKTGMTKTKIAKTRRGK